MAEQMQNRSLFETGLGIWDRRKWLLIPAFLTVFLVGISLVLALPSLYRSSTTLLFGQEDISESLVAAGINDQLTQRLEVVRREILSRDQLLDVARKFDLYPELREEAPDGAVVTRMRDDVIIDHELTGRENDPDTNIEVTISYQNWDPELVAAVTRELADRYKEANRTIISRRASRTAEFLSEEIASVRQQLAEQEARINEFKTRNLGGLPEQESANLSSLERLNSQLRLNGQRQVQLMERLDALLAGYGAADDPDGALEGGNRLAQLERRLADMQSRYTENFPGIVRLKNQIAELEANPPDPAQEEEGEGEGMQFQLVSQDPGSIEEEIARLREQEEELHARIELVQQRIENTPKVEQELSQLNSEYQTIRDEYQGLQERYRNARLVQSLQNQQDQKFLVLEEALPPDFPFAPSRLQLMAMTLVMAVGFAGGLGLLREQMDPTFHNLQDLRNHTRLPVMGTIATISTPGDRWRNGMRFLLGTLIFLVALAVLVLFAYNYGQNGQELVWMMA